MINQVTRRRGCVRCFYGYHFTCTWWSACLSLSVVFRGHHVGDCHSGPDSISGGGKQWNLRLLETGKPSKTASRLSRLHVSVFCTWWSKWGIPIFMFSLINSLSRLFPALRLINLQFFHFYQRWVHKADPKHIPTPTIKPFFRCINMKLGPFSCFSATLWCFPVGFWAQRIGRRLRPWGVS